MAGDDKNSKTKKSECATPSETDDRAGSRREGDATLLNQILELNREFNYLITSFFCIFACSAKALYDTQTRESANDRCQGGRDAQRTALSFSLGISLLLLCQTLATVAYESCHTQRLERRPTDRRDNESENTAAPGVADHNDESIDQTLDQDPPTGAMDGATANRDPNPEAGQEYQQDIYFSH